MKQVYPDCHKFWLVFAQDTFNEALANEKGLFGETYFEVRHVASQDVLGSFKLTPLPGNCGVVVSTATEIRALWRGRGHAKVLHHVKEYVATKLGYKIMLSTVVWNNEPQLRSAIKAGWRTVKNFINKRTNNPTHLMVKELQ